MNIDDLTLGEMALVEDMSGQPLSDLSDDGKPKSRLLIALVTVIKKREDPSYKKSDAEKLTMVQLNEVLNLGEAVDPKG